MINVPVRSFRMQRFCLHPAAGILRMAFLVVLSLALPFIPLRAGEAQAETQAAATAQTPRAVIELFTSQGCSACPPADAKVVAMARDPDLIALTLHVDYWDYLGWEDTLAQPAFSERQRGYAEQRGDRGVFTPQMVVNGLYACIGSDARAIEASLASAARHTTRLPVPVSLTREGRDLTIVLHGDHAGGGEIWLLQVEALVTVGIERGENKGREARYGNVVRAMTRIAAWDGTAMQLTARLPDATGRFVVLVQHRADALPGQILGAARGDGLRAAH